MADIVSNSEFHMWRTIFALAHADNKVSNEEVRYMAEVLEDIPFSEAQQRILRGDIHDPQDPEMMFSAIDNPEDRAALFEHAKTLVWVDGEYDDQEQAMVLKLLQRHIKSVTIDNLRNARKS